MNIINAIMNLASCPVIHLVQAYKGHNRANSAGAALEEYIKDLFAGTFNSSEPERHNKYDKVFSYLGNNSNPPDAMLRGGDAIEVKKIESVGKTLELNSSHPRHKLVSSSPMISRDCRGSEKWDEKDIIYAVGVVDKQNNLKRLCMVYGRDYCASEAFYTDLSGIVRQAVKGTPNLNFDPNSKEIARIKKVDPLGVTDLRIRNMWVIENPWKVFEYVYKPDQSKSFDFMCIIDDDKWNSFKNTGELSAMKHNCPNLDVVDVQIKDPDHPKDLYGAKLITYSI